MGEWDLSGRQRTNSGMNSVQVFGFFLILIAGVVGFLAYRAPRPEVSAASLERPRALAVSLSPTATRAQRTPTPYQIAGQLQELEATRVALELQIVADQAAAGEANRQAAEAALGVARLQATLTVARELTVAAADTTAAGIVEAAEMTRALLISQAEVEAAGIITEANGVLAQATEIRAGIDAELAAHEDRKEEIGRDLDLATTWVSNLLWSMLKLAVPVAILVIVLALALGVFQAATSERRQAMLISSARGQGPQMLQAYEPVEPIGSYGKDESGLSSSDRQAVARVLSWAERAGGNISRHAVQRESSRSGRMVGTEEWERVIDLLRDKGFVIPEMDGREVKKYHLKGTVAEIMAGL